MRKNQEVLWNLERVANVRFDKNSNSYLVVGFIVVVAVKDYDFRFFKQRVYGVNKDPVRRIIKHYVVNLLVDFKDILVDKPSI